MGANGMRVYVIYLEYRNGQAPSEAQLFNDFLRSKGMSPILIVVNTGDAQPVSLAYSESLSSENTFAEFSGWQLGIGHIQDRILDEDWLILANDTWQKGANLKHLKHFDLHEANSYSDCLFGVVDRAEVQLEALGLSSDRWIRTFFVAARWKTFRRLLPLIPKEFSVQEIYRLQPQNFFSDSNIISDEMKVRLLDWLLIDHRGRFSEKWPRAFSSVTEENFSQVTRKSTSIILEFALTARALSIGIPIFDLRRSRNRAYGVFWLIDRLGLFEKFQNWQNSVNRFIKSANP